MHNRPDIRVQSHVKQAIPYSPMPSHPLSDLWWDRPLACREQTGGTPVPPDFHPIPSQALSDLWWDRPLACLEKTGGTPVPPDLLPHAFTASQRPLVGQASGLSGKDRRDAGPTYLTHPCLHILSATFGGTGLWPVGKRPAGRRSHLTYPPIPSHPLFDFCRFD